MHFDDIHAALVRAVSAPGRLEKERMIQELADDDEGLGVLIYAYDPFKTYGLGTKTVTELLNRAHADRKLGVQPANSLDVFSTLDQMAQRHLTGTVAQVNVQNLMTHMTSESAEVVARILLKDLKAGITEVTINKVIPGLIPTFAVQRAHPFDAVKVKSWPVKVEPKLDGQRNTLLIRNGTGGFFTRAGKPVPALDFLVKPVLDVARILTTFSTGPDQSTLDAAVAAMILDADDGLAFALDGEALVGLFADIGALRRKSADAVDAELHLYDILSYKDFVTPGAQGPIHSERRRILERFVAAARQHLGRNGSVQIAPSYFAHDESQVMALYDTFTNKTLAAYLARGDAECEQELLAVTIDKATGRPKTLEGAMVKDPNGLYEKRKSYAWMKLKGSETFDIPVVDAFPGEPRSKYENCLGGLIVDFNGVRVRVGGGFTDQERWDLWNVWTTDPSALIGRLMEVEAHEITPDKSLRHPRFLRWRDDKQGERDNMGDTE